MKNVCAVCFSIFMLFFSVNYACSGVSVNDLKSGKLRDKYFYYEVKDNRIVHDSVCSDLPSGSIEKYKCRKSAKKFFKQQCEAVKDVIKFLKDNPDKKAEYGNWADDNLEQYCKSPRGFVP